MSEFIHTAKTQDTVFDVDAEQLAGIYAQAALDAAGDLPSQEAVAAELKSVVEEVLDREPRLETLFDSRMISEADKLGMLDRLLGARTSPTTLHVLKVLARHGRLGIVRDLARVTAKMVMVRANRVAVELETANTLDPALEQDILSALKRVLKADPVVSHRVNPELIAGFVIRVADRVYDASVRTSLEHTRQAMIAKAVEAIQTRPEKIFSKEA